jgi:predicted NBD/HSP70 family sugar kinase
MSIPTSNTATTRAVRRHNAEQVLDAVRASGPLRVAEIAALTGLSRPTVDSVADDLIALGLFGEVAPVSVGPTRTGRPARHLAFRAEARHVVAIDFGVHTLRVAVSDLRGDIRSERRLVLPIPQPQPDERLTFLDRVVEETLADAAIRIGAIARVSVAFPGVVDPASGVVSLGALPSFNETDVRTALHHRFGRPVLVENDANLGILGERWRGAAASARNAIYVLAGERLGAGILANGALIRGGRGAAGEMEFMTQWEGSGGAWGIAHLTRTLGAKAHSPARSAGAPADASTAGDPDVVDAKTIIAAATQGDQIAAEIVNRVTTRVARAVATLALVLNPDLIVIGGGVVDAGEIILDPIRRQIERITPIPTRVEPSALHDRGPLVGAIRHALDDLEPELLDGLDRGASASELTHA